MKIYIQKGYFHHMNKMSLDDIISHLKWEKVKTIEEADVIYSPSTLLNTESHPNKQFIFGPHFSVFPNDNARKISGKNKNAIYIQPSQPSVDTWANEFKFDNIPVKPFPFPLRINNYNISSEEKDIVLLYHKQRSPNELKFIKEFIKSKGLKYETVMYGSYKEENYQNQLNRAKYVIWHGRHESQGFALESVMCKNIPLLVWGVKLRNQEYPLQSSYVNVKSEVSTVPYWDESCGELFFNSNELESNYEKFIKNLENYNPRKFIENTLTVDTCSNRLVELIDEIKVNQEI